jgi:uncharacterized Zn-finger protein
VNKYQSRSFFHSSFFALRIATMQVESLFISHTVLAGEQISLDNDDDVSDEDLEDEFDLEDEDHLDLDTESKSFLCPYEGCGKQYPKAAKLKQHLLSHTGEVNPEFF